MQSTTNALLVESRALSTPITLMRNRERPLLLLFLLSLALLNPWVRGDGVGYYAFARAPLIDHSLNFEHDYIAANTAFREARLDEHGQPKQMFRTRTGHLDNHFTVGPAMLWAPFLLLAHGGVLLARTRRRTASPLRIAWPWLWARRSGDSSGCSWHFAWRASMPEICGPSSRRWRFGGPARFRYTCISILPGRTRIPLLRFRCLFFIGTKRASSAPCVSGSCSP